MYQERFKIPDLDSMSSRCVDVGAILGAIRGEDMAVVALEPVRFGDFLVEKQLISDGQLLDALADHWISGRRLGETIVRRGYLSAEELSRHLAEFEGLTVVYV